MAAFPDYDYPILSHISDPMVFLTLKDLDNDLTHGAFELEGCMDLWSDWAERVASEDLERTCNNSDCANSGGCDPLPDYPSCIRCFDNDTPRARNNCGHLKSFLGEHLHVDGQRPPSVELDPFLDLYSALKDYLGGSSVRTTKTGLDQKIYKALKQASQMTTELRNSTPATSEASVQLDSIRHLLDEARVENLRVTAEVLRLRKNLCFMSRVIDKSLAVLYDTNITPLRPAHETGREILRRCKDIGLLF